MLEIIAGLPSFDAGINIGWGVILTQVNSAQRYSRGAGRSSSPLLRAEVLGKQG